MIKKNILGLLVLWFFVVMYKYPIWENLAFYIGRIAKGYGTEIYDISFFCAVFLFPFLLSLFFLYFLLKYKNNYFIIIEWILTFIITIAIFFAFHGLFWVWPSLDDNLPILGGLLGYMILAEGYLSVSLILLFIALFFFAFGNKNSKITVESIFWLLLFLSPIILGSIYLSTSRYKIPEDVKCEEVSQKAIPKEELSSAKNNFEINGGYGYYSFYVNFHPKDKGYLYIKAFEITTNDLLSDEYLDDWSKSIIDDVNSKIYSGNFTINKGAGDRYCARIELWFKPNNGKEYMLNQKNYTVEGKD